MKRDQDQRLSLAYTVLFGGREKTCIEAGRRTRDVEKEGKPRTPESIMEIMLLGTGALYCQRLPESQL